MRKRFYLITRDLHLYTGLFVSPFVVVFALSVFVLVHPSSEAGRSIPPMTKTAGPVALRPDIENLSGRARVEALRPVLNQLGINGEIGFVGYSPKEHRLKVPVVVPGRETTVDVDLASRTATVTERQTGAWDALALLHKSPGPHLAEIRMNWIAMRIWSWFADATAYLLLFISASGIYLWVMLRSERRAGLAMLIAGALTFCGVVYALAG
jgi:hypothetical protein